MNDKDREKTADTAHGKFVEIDEHDMKTAFGGYAPDEQQQAVHDRRARGGGGLYIIDIDI